MFHPRIYSDSVSLSLEVSHAITFIQPGFHSLQWIFRDVTLRKTFCVTSRVEPMRGGAINDQNQEHINANHCKSKINPIKSNPINQN